MKSYRWSFVVLLCANTKQNPISSMTTPPGPYASGLSLTPMIQITILADYALYQCDWYPGLSEVGGTIPDSEMG